MREEGTLVLSKNGFSYTAKDQYPTMRRDDGAEHTGSDSILPHDLLLDVEGSRSFPPAERVGGSSSKSSSRRSKPDTWVDELGDHARSSVLPTRDACTSAGCEREERPTSWEAAGCREADRLKFDGPASASCASPGRREASRAIFRATVGGDVQNSSSSDLGPSMATSPESLSINDWLAVLYA